MLSNLADISGAGVEKDLLAGKRLTSSPAATVFETSIGRIQVDHISPTLVQCTSIGEVYIPRNQGIAFQIPICKVQYPIKDISLFGYEDDSAAGDPSLSNLLQRALHIGGTALPVRDKSEALLTVLLASVSYAYPWVAEELKHDAERTQWCKDIKSRSNCTLSKVAHYKLANCAAFAVLYARMAQEAGLQAVIMSDSYCCPPIINIARSNGDFLPNDERQNLFRLAERGGEIMSHAWCEVCDPENAGIPWIPVDPATQLIGNSPSRFNTFKKARYLGSVHDVVGTLPQGKFLSFTGANNDNYAVGGKTTTLYYKLTNSDRKHTNWAANTEIVLQAPEYKGPLNFSFSPPAQPWTAGLGSTFEFCGSIVLKEFCE